MTFDLNKHVARLLMDEPFFAALSRQVEKKPSEAIPTAGVRVNPDTATLEMIYNPSFFEGLSDAHRAGVLKHEFYHLVFEHVTGRLPEEGMSKLWNIATDLSINTHLQGELPDMCCMPGVGPFEDMPHGQSAEWYLKKLQDKQEGQENEDENGEGEPGEEPGEGSGEGQGTGEQFDSHEGWGEVDENVKQMARERIKGSIRKAAEEASKSNNWGSVSSECRREIMKKLETHVDWKKVLRYFVKTSQRANKASTMKRINRRYPYIHPGRKTARTASIAISIDQSGSVSDEMLAAFYAELNKLSAVAEFTVIPFDSQVFEEKIFVWKKGETRKRERVLYGGTDFDPPTDYVNQHNFDGHIVLTDLCAPKPKASKCQRMWMTDSYHARNPYFETNERVIAIEAEAA
jgi:predicted metal-dependent peptidase